MPSGPCGRADPRPIDRTATPSRRRRRTRWPDHGSPAQAEGSPKRQPKRILNCDPSRDPERTGCPTTPKRPGRAAGAEVPSAKDLRDALVEDRRPGNDRLLCRLGDSRLRSSLAPRQGRPDRADRTCFPPLPVDGREGDRPSSIAPTSFIDSAGTSLKSPSTSPGSRRRPRQGPPVRERPALSRRGRRSTPSRPS